ncbi:MAG: alpha/beta fold hydrolase [Defluviitaleaceae bacterium]|nr:alpha/beta fold hydrolase [Defluviitaleaceae bacterium]
MSLKKFLVVAMVIAMVWSASVAILAQGVNVSIEGLKVNFEGQPPAIVDGRTLVPVRGVFEVLGFDIEWDAETQTVTMMACENYVVIITVGSDTFTTNGEEFTLDVPAQIIGGRTMLPIRAVLESIGLYVGWDEQTSTVLISSLPISHDEIPQAEGLDRAALEGLISTFMNGIIAWDFDTAYSMMSEQMHDIDLQTRLLVSTGSMLEFSITDGMSAPDMSMFEVEATHTMGEATYAVVMDSYGTIIGLWVQDFAFVPLPVDEDAAFTAEEIVIGEGTDWPLDGIITMPSDASAESPVPAAILVHGSGAHNMDSSLFDNRPFWDIAEYLSSNGIAVLRYNKRTLAHGERFMQTLGYNATIWEETIYDAILAAEMLRADERIGDIYVIGLSLGGMLAPQIAEEASLAGVVMLAASPRSLYEIQYDQNVQAINDMLEAGLLSYETASELMEMVSELIEEARNMSNKPNEELANALIFGIPAVYQLSIVNALPLPIIHNSTRPTLILQGGRDFQVFTDIDFRIFQEQTQNLPHVKTILYSNLNHLFMESQTSYNDLREYIPAGNVDRQVLRDIVAWIEGLVVE